VAAQDFGGNVVELFGPGRGGRRVRPQEPRVTKRQIAEHFGVSTKTIERYMSREANPLPFEKPHERGAVRFVMSDVEAWWRGAAEPEAARATV
jgi:predicted DNA-binding transcriptional regulator AlpA